MINVCITACIRPEIIEKTLSSFQRYFWKDMDIRAIVNIDPVGVGFNQVTIADVVSKYFMDNTIRTPRIASFPNAFKWTWLQTDTDYVLHLEDDWELLRDVDVDEMINILEGESDLALLRLPIFHAGLEHMKNWNKFFPWNGRYYECPEELKMEVGFCGHPSLIKQEFVDRIAPYIDIRINPEKQFHHGPQKIMDEVAKWRYGVYAKPGDEPILRDIGRAWMVENGFQKSGNKAWFTHWETVK